MRTPVRLAGFLAVLGAAFGIALGVGNSIGPVSDPASAHDEPHGASHGTPSDGEQSGTAAPVGTPGGLMVSQDGYTFALAESTSAPRHSAPVSFTITGPDGRPVTAYEREHEKRLHLIAVRRDFTGFQHVHPELGTDGTWLARIDLTPGDWRLFADFTPGGADPLTLGADLSVAGDYQPAAPAGQSRTAEVDGYTVTLDGVLVPGSDAKLTLSVHKDGRPVTDLQPYLGAYGHLVALREGDLAYLHVHPDGSPGDGRTKPGPDVVFYAAVPSSGDYRLFLDFQHDGVVRTASFALPTAGTSRLEPTDPAHPTDGDTGTAEDHSGH